MSQEQITQEIRWMQLTGGYALTGAKERHVLMQHVYPTLKALGTVRVERVASSALARVADGRERTVENHWMGISDLEVLW